jgi:transaldolase
MEFFLDTASLEDIKKWEPFGVVQGATTNPTLLSKEGRDPLAQLQAVAAAVQGPVSAQVTHDTHEKMVRQGRALSQVAKNIVVKLPCNAEGFLAAKELVAEGVRLNITLTFDPAQAVPFCKLPVTYVSLIIGRVEDFGLNSRGFARDLRDVLDKLKSPTKLLVASIRNPHHLREAILAGADVITVPPSTWSNLYSHPLTTTGEEDFFTAWRTLPEPMRKAYEQLGHDAGKLRVER